jgi:ATP synthase protein I
VPKPDDQTPAQKMQTLGALSAVGIAFVLAVVIGFVIGYALDRWLGTRGVFTILFFFFGLAAGIVNVVRTAASYDRQRHDGPKPGGPV